MKKHRIASIISALFIVTFCLSMFTACEGIERIEEHHVEKISIWTHTTERYVLNAEDSAKFIELYNAAKYEGEATGEGGTPEFGIYVSFRDGTQLYANDFYSKFEVWLNDANGDKKEWYYISSNELYNFVSELANKIDDISK